MTTLNTMKRRYFYLLALLLIFFSCKEEKKVWTFEDFYEQTFSVIKNKSVKKNEINWDSLKQKVIDSIGVPSNNLLAYKSIAYTVKLIDDRHSIFVFPSDLLEKGQKNALLMDSLAVPKVESKIVKGSIGYIKLPGFVAKDSLTQLYAEKIRGKLLSLDRNQKIEGWIIDVSNNIGGQAGKEVLGLAPLFQKSLLGISKNGDGEYKKHTLKSNTYYRDTIPLAKLEMDSLMINTNKPIAILQGPKTVSAGEFLALAFKFQDKSRTFGQPTKGKTSDLELINFKSNAKLLLATDYWCNKEGNIIDGPIFPDVICSMEESLDLATEWINSFYTN